MFSACICLHFSLNVSIYLCFVYVFLPGCIPLSGLGQTNQVDPELFRVFYNFWKETEAEAQDINMPSEVIDRLDNNECVYKLSSCVKTSCGVGIVAMTQKRLFLLTQGQPGFLEITKFRDIQVTRL